MSSKKRERTLVLIKPDGVQRGLVGEIISRFERVGLKIVGLKILKATGEQIAEQYGSSREELESLGRRSIENQLKLGMKMDVSPYEQGRKIVDVLRKYMSSGPVVGIVLEGNGAVAVVRKIVGATEPMSSDVGTIRSDYTLDSYSLADADGRAVRNLVHCSGSPEEAEKEIKIWFHPDEVLKYRIIAEKILYDVNLDGIFE
jgi:nucleoside-diphosphate kinase